MVSEFHRALTEYRNSSPVDDRLSRIETLVDICLLGIDEVLVNQEEILSKLKPKVNRFVLTLGLPVQRGSDFIMGAEIDDTQELPFSIADTDANGNPVDVTGLTITEDPQADGSTITNPVINSDGASGVIQSLPGAGHLGATTLHFQSDGGLDVDVPFSVVASAAVAEGVTFGGAQPRGTNSGS